MKTYKLWIGSIILALTLQACNLKLVDAGSDPNAPGYELTVTANAALIETAMASGAQPPADAGQPAGVDQPPAAVDAPPPTEDPNNASLNTATPTVSSTNGTTVTVSIATNCRTGPGQAYPSIYGLPVGVVGKVVGNNPSVSNYWVIEIPNSGGGTCWLWGQYATVTGDTNTLKVVAVPATPTPTATLTPTATKVVAPAAPSNATSVLLTCVTDPNSFIQTFTATFTWTDNSNNETGFNIYVNANFANGSSVDILSGSVGPNTTSYTVSTTALSKQPPIIKVEAFNNAGSSTRVSAQPLSLATCP
ncbi:MAG TPA: hypothetical protein PLG52_04760 [Anaerolineales bacterium]|nr:hypothetical protein [Anaerolineales bacterium]